MPIEERLTGRMIRSFAFLRKELLTVFRQPRLIITLVVGPFLILLLFGLGYRETPEPFRTVIVAEEGDLSLGVDTVDLEESFGDGIDLVETTTDEESARRQLANGDVDLVILAPTDASETLERGERAKFSILHAEIDPVLTGTLSLMARLSVDEFNRHVLAGVVQEIQSESEQVNEPMATVAEAADELEQVERAQNTDPAVVVSPYEVETSGLIEPPSSQAAFYAPGVLVLLVQHLALTFAALSLVRERQLGITEIFRVSPLTVRETLIGKYISFLALGLLVAAGLTATMLLLGVEIQGSYWSLALVVALVIIASLGLGFAMSGLAKSDSQAVQFSMVLLLLSIFFTGFLLPLDQLTVPFRWVSYLVPGTYGIEGLHDVIFRGHAARPELVGGLSIYALMMAALSRVALRRDVEPIRA